MNAESNTPPPELRLDGAGADRTIVRIGDTVHRPTGYNTELVHAVLTHLDRAGFEGSPRVLGFDEKGREVLTFLPGVEGRSVEHSPATLRSVAALIRRFHDAIADFPVPDPGPVGSGAIMCHNDLAPYNTLYQQGRASALIDWDLVDVGTRFHDLVYAAWRYVPLYTDDDCRTLRLPVPPSRGPRLQAFVRAYGQSFDGSVFVSELRSRLATVDRDFARRSLRWIDDVGGEWESYLS